MRTCLLRRLLALVPTLFFASLIVFFTVRLIPGDVIDMMLSQNDVSADPLSRAQMVADPQVEQQRPRVIVRGEVPSALRPPSGCRFTRAARRRWRSAAALTRCSCRRVPGAAWPATCMRSLASRP